MRRLIKFTTVILLLIGLLIPFYLLGRYGKADDILGIFSAIVSVAALVFTVAGLWAGFVFPDAIKIILGNASTEEKRKQTKQYGNILIPVLLALICTVLSTAAPIIAKVLKIWQYPEWAMCTFKISGSGIAYLITLCLLWSIIKVISPSIHWFNLLEKRTKSDELADRRMPKK